MLSFGRALTNGFLLLVMLGLSQSAFATVDGFWVWKPAGSEIRFLIPKLEGVDPAVFVKKYEAELKRSDVYGKMENAQKLDLSSGVSVFEELPESSFHHPNVAVILNRPDQMTRHSTYLKKVIDSFEREGPRLFSVPVGLETVLSPQELQQFRSQINDMDGLLGVGGDDPHPLTYQQTDTSKTMGDISHPRDQEQIAYIREYLQHGKGRVYLICGSMQRGAIADGYGFHPDISHLTEQAHSGREGPVLVEIEADPESEIARAAGATRFRVSSSHHAGIDEAPRDPLNYPPASRVTAHTIEPDGLRGRIVQAIEFPENAGFATQFHAEFRGSPEENRIIQHVAMGWKLRSRVSPGVIANCLSIELENEF